VVEAVETSHAYLKQTICSLSFVTIIEIYRLWAWKFHTLVVAGVETSHGCLKQFSCSSYFGILLEFFDW